MSRLSDAQIAGITNSYPAFNEAKCLAVEVQDSRVLIKALNELVGELTRHADALRAALSDAIDRTDAQTAQPWHYAIAAYDDFIAEA